MRLSIHTNEVLARLFLIAGVGLYIALFHFTYVELISPTYSYLGYTYFSPGAAVLITGILLAWVPSLQLPRSIDRPSQVVYWVLFIIVYVPCMLVPLYTLVIDLGLWIFQFTLCACFLLLGVVYRFPLIKIRRARFSPLLFWAFVTSVSLTFFALIFQRFGLQIRLLSLSDVYGVRYEYRDELAANGRLVAYAIAWQSGVLNPLIIGFGFSRRKPLLITLGFVAQLTLFSITGMKSILFSTLLIALIFVAYGHRGRKFGPLAAWGAVFIIGFSAAFDLLRDTSFLVSLFVRRLIATSGMLTGFYYDFFSSNEKARYAWSFLGPFFDYPYDVTPPFLIGSIYLGNPQTSANANVWADAFANFGLIGLVGITILLAILLWMYDCLTVETDPRIAVLLLGVPSITLASSSLPTAMLTHGLGLVFLLAFVMPGNSSQQRDYRFKIVWRKRREDRGTSRNFS